MAKSPKSMKDDQDNKPVLVFDLDNTLIYSSPLPVGSYHFCILVERRRLYVKIRPWVLEFFDRISDLYDIYFFTSSNKSYARPIIKKIAPFVADEKCFFRDSCIADYGYYLKDITKIKTPINQTVLIDDTFGSGVLNPKNIVCVPFWDGSCEDNVFEQELYPILIECSKETNFIDSLMNKISSKSKKLQISIRKN